MMYIITGPINSGKTTKMMEIFRAKGGNGFISLKLMESNRVIGFDIMKLSTKEKKPFIRRSDELPDGWCENCKLGPYSISQKAVDWVTVGISEMIEQSRFPIYLDEAGILEIEDKCLSASVNYIANAEGEIYISVRDTYKEALIDRFSIVQSKTIYTGERYA